MKIKMFCRELLGLSVQSESYIPEERTKFLSSGGVFITRQLIKPVRIILKTILTGFLVGIY